MRFASTLLANPGKIHGNIKCVKILVMAISKHEFAYTTWYPFEMVEISIVNGLSTTFSAAL